jgi:hypothetical protein
VIAAALLLNGCAVTTSTGNLRFFPSREAAAFVCSTLAYEYMPPFIYLPDDMVPKRATLYVSLRDERTSTRVLSYRARLRASPRNLDSFSSLDRELLTIKTHDRNTQQSWTLQFRRESDGLFKLVSRQGDFRD